MLYKYKFIFIYKDKKVEKIVESSREREEAFDHACAVLDFTDCNKVLMFEYNKQYDEWYECTDLY